MSPLRAAGFASRLRRAAAVQTRLGNVDRAAALTRMASACQSRAVLPW